jgi:hypothetical protein
MARNLRTGTAHVDVDDVGAHAFDDARRSAIFVGIAAEDLDRDTGRSSSVYSAYSSVRSMPRTRPSDDTISVTTSRSRRGA